MQTIKIDVIEYGQRSDVVVFSGQRIASGTFTCRDDTEWTNVYRRADGKVVLENGSRSHWAKEAKTGRNVSVEVLEEDDLKRWLERHGQSTIALKISDQLGLGISPDNWA